MTDTTTKFYSENMFKIAIAEMENTLKNNKVPINNYTKKAFILGVQVASIISAEIASQMLMDMGTDEMSLKAIDAQKTKSEA